MKKIRKMLAVILSMVMIIAIMPTVVYAKTYTDGDLVFYYQIVGD